jgi:hypothetical protein
MAGVVLRDLLGGKTVQIKLDENFGRNLTSFIIRYRKRKKRKKYEGGTASQASSPGTASRLLDHWILAGIGSEPRSVVPAQLLSFFLPQPISFHPHQPTGWPTRAHLLAGPPPTRPNSSLLRLDRCLTRPPHATLLPPAHVARSRSTRAFTRERARSPPQ